MLGCQIEDRTPTGSRRDEDTIQHLLSRYARRLSARDWSGVRSLFWQDGSYAGPIGPGAPQSMERWLRGVEPGNFDVRVVRTDLRQDGDLAAAWLTTRRVTPSGPTAIDGDWVEHIVLRRIDDDWRILSVSVATPGRRSAH